MVIPVSLSAEPVPPLGNKPAGAAVASSMLPHITRRETESSIWEVT